MGAMNFGMNYEVLVGDCRQSLKDLAARGIKAQTCVTSPPYFGLRDYGVDGQLGLEQTPEQYVAAMVEVFRAVRDVLSDDGTLWLNIGDTYGKGKQLLGIPWRLALALQADGWVLRQDIIWHKPNPMPASVRDRCTTSHEYVFLLSKSEKYFFDSEAMKEPAVGNAKGAAASFKRSGSKREQKIPNQGYGTHRPEREDIAYNRRSVWTVSTRSYSGAHFAVFPPALIEPCVLAGTSERGHCPGCGARLVREIERKRIMRHELPKDSPNYRPGRYTVKAGGLDDYAKGGGQAFSSSKTIGWSPTCSCGLEPVQDVVLDPFGGSGTTAGVALLHGRRAVLCELNAEYADLVPQRVESILHGKQVKQKQPQTPAQQPLIAT